MANDNHETYGDVDICTYTDDITTQNSFTADQIMSYVLSAGVVPWFTNTASVITGRYSHESATGGANSNVPFYKESSSQILWYDDSALEMIPADNMYRYKHCVYLAKNNNSNKIATSLKIVNYKNVLTIATRNYSDIHGNPVKFYSPIINTMYGSGNEWFNSVLTPSFLYRNLNDIVGGQSVGSNISVSRWWWGDENDTGNDLWGHDLYDRNLQYGTDMGGREKIPWELPGTDPIRISEGTPDATFPCRFDNEHLTWAFYGNNPLELYVGTNNIEDCLLLCAFCGLKFEYNGTTYKPLAENGVVYGYTDDMNRTSEWDNWRDIGDHVIPDTPPSPPLDPWDVDPETYGWSGGEVSGMVKYYLLTAGQMSSLQTAISSYANWTIDYLNCVVSCFVVPNNGLFFDAPIATTVKFKLDNATQWDTGVACSRIQGTKNKSGGTIEIPRLTNTFYDFEPYSDYSVYIPFCGRIPIKGNLCLGREIKVTYYPDVPTCSLTAVVSCGGATIAIAKGSFGTMTPVTSNGSDRKTAAVIGDVAPIITGIGTGIVGVALGNPLIVGAGAAQALGGVMGGVKETVQSYAYSVGSSGDSSFFGAGNRCYYYANYPLIDEVVNNSMFGHSVGYLCNTVGKLSGFKGFTICANPHVTFSATSEEREEIERLLSMGVIL